jgi:hypothetical protein
VPKEKKKVVWKDVIFDQKITNELRANYKHRFGYSSSQQNLDALNRYEELTYGNGYRVTAEEDSKKKQEFGDYMTKRLVEYHFDRILKTNSNTKRVYEFKEKLSHVSVQVKKGFNLSSRYYYSGNYFDLKLTTPYRFTQVVSLRMNPNSFGPTPLNEVILSSYYSLTQKLNFALNYHYYREWLSFVINKRFRNGLTSTLSFESYINDLVTGVLDQRHNRVILGMNWNY